ncbi:MAG: O-antigen ligase family protein, partial [Bacteroidales bacterium]|nr:O-antigen ligase family protein [Bacteroidales bacterium]
VAGVTYITLNFGYLAGLGVAFAPLFVLYLIQILDKPIWGFVTLFIMNYYISGVSRYVKAISPGIFMDIILIITLISLFLQFFKSNSKYNFSSARNKLTLIAFVWVLYCTLQLLNPEGVIIAWLTAVRSIGIYFFVVIVISSVILKEFKDLKMIIFIWAILAITAVFKAFAQKMWGFDTAEMNWLYVDGAARTHIIYSGVRYFSFFTDAANFGSGIAFSGVVFAITAIFAKSIKLKLFYFLAFAACMYGMVISGTRGAVAVPFVGFALLGILSKDWRIISLTAISVILAFVFLKYTSYGNANSYIRRMRSVFSTEDASFQVRIQNQRRLRDFMRERPFGVGIGMSRGRATTYRPNEFLLDKPNDSWYVMIWVETGIVGLILHISILLSIFGYGAYTVLFKLKDREIKGFTIALLCGISGLYVSAYSIEIMGQFPSAFILYIAMTGIFMSRSYERSEEESQKSLDNQNIYYYELNP